MESDRESSIPSPITEDPTGATPPEASPKRSVEKGSVFWKELYWFVIVVILGASAAMWVLPSRIHRHRGLAELQSELRQKNALLEREERKFESAVDAMKHDEFYRQAVWRRVIGVKRNSEQFLNGEGLDRIEKNRESETISPQDEALSDR